MELDEAPGVLEDQSVDEDEIMEEVLTPGAAMEEQEAGQEIFLPTMKDSDQPKKIFQFNLDDIAWRKKPIKAHEHHTFEAMEAKTKKLDKLCKFKTLAQFNWRT